MTSRLDTVQRIRQECGADYQEYEREACQQDVQGDFIGSLLALCTFHQADHAVQKALARVGGNAHHQPVGEQARPAGHRAAVSTQLADHGSAFTGDSTFVHRCNAFDDLAVHRQGISGFHQEDIILVQRRRGNQLVFGLAVRAGEFFGLGGLAGFAKRFGLGLTTPFGDGLGEVGEKDGEPQPDSHTTNETGRGFAFTKKRLNP